MKQADLFNDVCETQSNTSSSDVSLIVSTSMETTGQTHTKTCNTCNTELTDLNWYKGFQKNRTYKCKPCTRAYQIPIERARNMLKKIKEGTLAQFNKIKTGDIYVITNPAWPDWVKIGRGVDAKDRFKDYMTYSPFRDYKLEYYVHTDNRSEAEHKAHVEAEKLGERRNEWFNISLQQAKDILNGL